MHGITVAAMKSKQSTAAANTTKVRELVAQFVPTYFSAEDLAHLRESHGFGGHDEHGHDHDGGHDGGHDADKKR